MATAKRKTQGKGTTTIVAPATAAGQALGYSLQYTRLTALLLSAPEESVCSLEVLDDVAVENSAGEQYLVQSKSALGANPVSDRASSLWKTLFNWIQLVQRGLVNPDKAIFELYVSRPVDGTIIKASRDVWGGNKNIVEFEEWRNGIKLVPEDWISHSEKP